MLEEKVRETIKKNEMLTFGDKILVGVSGGPDSVALLQILYSFREEYNLSLHVAHLNHRLRGEEANKDANLVKNLAENLNLAYEIKSCPLDLKKIAQEEGWTLEETARKYRYLFYEEMAKKFGTDKIALGHNANDQAETVLMRFLRGSGLEGLRGMPAVRGKIIRPLIDCYREEIEEYCREHKLEYRIDSTNKEAIYFRNKIRLELLPLLTAEYNKNIKNILLQLSRVVNEVSAYLEEETEVRFKETTRVTDREKVVIDLNQLNLLPLVFKRRIIRKAIEVVKGDLQAISFVHSEEVLRLIESRGGEKEITLPAGLKVKKIYQQLIIYKKNKDKIFEVGISPGGRAAEPRREWEYPIAVPGSTKINLLGLKVEAKILGQLEVDPSFYYKKNYYEKKEREKSEREFNELMDYDQVKLPLKLRNRRAGDKFHPLKMKGEKKVKDFFIDYKVPKSQRGLISLLVDREDQILWIVGMRLDHRVRITPHTKKVLSLNIKSKSKRLDF